MAFYYRSNAYGEIKKINGTTFHYKNTACGEINKINGMTSGIPL